jgi:hypothetical protein
MLGIDIEAGDPKSFGPASGGVLETYGHMVNFEFFGITGELRLPTWLRMTF